MEVLLTLQFLVIGFLLWYIKKRNDNEASLIAQKIESSLKLKRTMAMGLAYRFNYPRKRNEDNETVFEKATNIFLKETPFEFEHFVSEIMQKRFGGKTYITVKTGDFGVDFEHNREDGLYLGQVKAYKNDLDFSPIALIHSNMIKRGAKGGYVVTTSDFTSSAKEYARELNIELIDGIQLVNYWLESIESKVYEPNSESV
ncbi:restriction endonuclease [Virgibacillus sp. C22-A2]|uniref:Restriction endonuclease n=1 Tax=Virgibacillus tibetensis TaxID=3042313 RepID=A0ABU6KKR1_9BACI|nr:restriction endonuclease [Virgibacillus sp. C22-A2]